jgi:signal transduction histidine kinase
MDILSNLDLLSVAVVVAATMVLGFSVYFNNPKSITNKTFLWFALITAVWGVVNYSAYQTSNPVYVLWLLRFIMFFAVWQAFAFFQFSFIFPKLEEKFSRAYMIFLIPLVALTSFVTLTPLLFSEIVELTEIGRVSDPDRGPGLFLFGVVTVGLVMAGIVMLIKQVVATKELEVKRSSKLLLLGALMMFILIIIFNFLIPIFTSNRNFIPLGALFVFPFVAFTSYAILKHKLFNIKVAATASLTFVLSIVTFLEIIFARDLSQVIFRSSVFILVLVFGIMLIRTVLKEVRLREEVEILAGTLQKANTRLRELDKLKSEFVSFATHQIRAPVTAIKGYASMILEGSFGPIAGKLKDAVDKIFQSSESMVLVIEDYLNISKIELGRMQYAMSDFDFKKLVEDIAVELTPTIKKAGLDVSVHKELGKNYRIKGDSGKLRQVITNLIDNSIKYTPKGSIRIELSKNDISRKILFAVSDTGVGFSKETLPHLFEKFKRAKNANNVNIHGTGLGLFIAKQIIEAHKGRIWAQSQGEGKGATFFVEVDAEK